MPEASGPMPSPTQPPPISMQQLQSDMETIRAVLEEGEAERGPHRAIIAGGNLFCGAIILVVVPVILLVCGISLFQPGDPGEKMAIGLVGLIPTTILLLIASPFLLAGYGLLKRKSWGPAFALIAGALNLFNLPLGTALAIYTFWAVGGGHLGVRKVRS